MTDYNAAAIEAALRLVDRLRTTPLNEREAARLETLLDSRMNFASPNPLRSGFLDEAGRLRIAHWADDLGIDAQQVLGIDLSRRPTPMVATTATGLGLVSNGHLGVDVIRVAAGQGFAPHTHGGDHLLIVIGGRGTIAYDGVVYETNAGDVYLIEGDVPHAVGAITDHVILAVGVPHQPVDSDRRQAIVEYEAVAAGLGDLACDICQVTAKVPLRLADVGCPHCPSRFGPDETAHVAVAATDA